MTSPTNMLVVSFFFVLLMYNTNAFKILVVFTVPNPSHSILGDGYVRCLLNAGHEVTYISSMPYKGPPSENLRQIILSSNLSLFPTAKAIDAKLMIDNKNPRKTHLIMQNMFRLSNVTLSDKHVQRLINDPKESFDVVIAEWMYNEIYAGLASVFECPMIWSSSLNPHGLVLSLIDEYTDTAYTASHISSYVTPPFTILQRVEELILKYKTLAFQWYFTDLQRKIYNAAYSTIPITRGRVLPSFDEVKYNSSLILGNSHVSIGDPVRLPANYISISGYHIKDEVDPLPDALEDILNNATNGVIYMSLGSILQTHTLPENMIRDLLNLFGTLEQTVIWKFEASFHDVPQNVHLIEWAPQQGILEHPNCILFITHGGLLSLSEAYYFGVPVIGVPIFADQFINVHRVAIKGIGLGVTFDYDWVINLKAAIKEILSDSRYQKKMEEASMIFHDRPVSPQAELVHWVEHVIKTRGAPHLRSHAVMMPWYQKIYLDIIVITFIIIHITHLLINQCLQKIRSTKKKLS